jgi:hypothetical protein
MKMNLLFTTDKAGIMAGATLLAALVGCVPSASNQRSGNEGRSEVQPQTTVVVQDDYDYYPGYETYYSRNRHEYVYRDGNAWVRRPEPRGVAVNVLLAAPSVRMDFHDSPEQHHNNVVRSYPKDWKQAGKVSDKKNDKKDADRKDGDKRD